MKRGVGGRLVGELVGVLDVRLGLLSLTFFVLTVSPFMNFLARLFSSRFSFFSRLCMSSTLSPPAAAAVPSAGSPSTLTTVGAFLPFPFLPTLPEARLILPLALAFLRLRPRGSSSAVATIPAVARVRAGARDNGKSAQSVLRTEISRARRAVTKYVYN